MNYLAHALLSYPNEPLTVGNLLCDLVKRKADIARFPLAAQEGIKLHHSIDRFVDLHPAAKRSVETLRASQGRYATVVIDVAYDYFLAKNWHRFSDVPLREFSNQIYIFLQNHYPYMPEKTQELGRRMIADDFIYNYQDLERYRFLFQRLIMRAKGENNFIRATDDMKQHEASLEADFNALFPDLLAFVKQKIAALSFDF
jgi:acyl carrier protein phosphodiesterase